MMANIGELEQRGPARFVGRNFYRNQPDAFYRTNVVGLSRIHASRVRSIDHAARRFAHRLAEKAFGHGARCAGIWRLGANDRAVRYRANLRGANGMSQRIQLDVWRP